MSRSSSVDATSRGATPCAPALTSDNWHTQRKSTANLCYTRIRLLCSGTPEDPDGDRYFRPFQLACQHKSAKIKALALDVINKMIGAQFCWV